MSMNVSLTAIEEKLSYFMKKFKIIISFVFFDKATVLPKTWEVLKNTWSPKEVNIFEILWIHFIWGMDQMCLLNI